MLSNASESISMAERRQALRDALASTPFRRSVRLRRLLSYVVERVLEGDDTSLSEQKIGMAVFERRASYDTGADNIVRVNATELRKRLEAFYADEGASAPVLIKVPRGSYKPTFHRRAPEAADVPLSERIAEEPEAVTTAGPYSEPGPKLWQTSSEEQPVLPLKTVGVRRLLLPLVSVLLMIALSFGAVQTVRLHLLSRQIAPWRNGRISTQFWQNFFAPNQTTTIVLADTSFALAQDLSNYQLTLDDYLRQGYRQGSGISSLSALDETTKQRVVAMMASRNSGSIADFVTARHILALNPVSPALHIQFARDFSGEALRQDSTILIGSTRSNPWVEPFQEKLFYRMQASPVGSNIEVHVTRPTANEKASYSTSAAPNRTDGFCIVAFLPSLNGEGKTLIIAGTDSQATEAGGDFMVQENTLELLEGLLPGFTRQPFQVLLKTSRVVGSPLSTSVLSIRRGVA